MELELRQWAACPLVVTLEAVLFQKHFLCSTETFNVQEQTSLPCPLQVRVIINNNKTTVTGKRQVNIKPYFVTDGFIKLRAFPVAGIF